MRDRVILVCQRSNNVPFVFEAAERMGLALTVVASPDEKAPAHMPAVDDVLIAPVFDDPEAALSIVADYAAHRPVKGIATQREEAMIWTAKAAERLGLPGIGTEAAYAARDKAEMRRRFRAAGLNTPAYIKIAGLADLDRIEPPAFPVVVKPATAYGSSGVILCRTEDELRAAVATVEKMNAAEFARFSRSDAGNFAGIVIEGFIDGPEFLAECFARDGEVRVLAVGYKGNPRGPYFEETIYRTPPRIDAAIRDAIVAEAKGGMRALGLVNGPGHCELRLHSDGRPHILEIGARLGGSGTSGAVVEYSTGIDYAGLQYEFVTGRDARTPMPPDVPENGAASNYIIPLGGSGRLQRIDGLDQLSAHPDFRRLLRFMPDGSVVAPYPKFDGFIGFVLGQHRNAAEAEEFQSWLGQVIRPVWS